MTVITRFAPSPTGSLHLGGARTALFNYLYAKKNSGKFRLRIEDTDRNRNTEESAKIITTSLKWLGLQVDDDIIYQSDNQAEHRQIAESLLSKGLAYKCYHNKEYIKQFSNSKKKFHSEWRDKQSQIPPNKDFCIRIKSPENHNHIIKDKKGIYVSNRDIDSLSETARFIIKNYKKIQNEIGQNKFILEKEMFKQISEIIKSY